MTSPLVVVFGGTRVAPETPLYQRGYRLGALLAQAGLRVASGGYQGIMEAVSRGAAEAGGHVIGYTCDVFQDVTPNPWLHEERRTSTLTDRIGRMAGEGDAFIALHGGIGTLAEIAVIWNLRLIDGLPPKPLILLGPEWPPLLDALRAYTQIGRSAFDLITWTATPEEAVATLLDVLRTRSA